MRVVDLRALMARHEVDLYAAVLLTSPHTNVAVTGRPPGLVGLRFPGGRPNFAAHAFPAVLRGLPAAGSPWGAALTDVLRLGTVPAAWE